MFTSAVTAAVATGWSLCEASGTFEASASFSAAISKSLLQLQASLGQSGRDLVSIHASEATESESQYRSVRVSTSAEARPDPDGPRPSWRFRTTTRGRAPSQFPASCRRNLRFEHHAEASYGGLLSTCHSEGPEGTVRTARFGGDFVQAKGKDSTASS